MMSSMEERLEGKVALITGAAGGIGRATALRFAREGARVVATDLEDAPIDETVASVEATGGEILGVGHDVTRWEDWQRAVAEAERAFGGLDCLVNNAGIEGTVAPIDETSEESFDAVLAVNVKGVFLGIKAAIPALRRRGAGSIVNIASVAGVIGDASIAPYVASKHAVIGLTKSTATGYGADQIRANAVCPSPIDTRMMRALEEGLMPGYDGDVKEMMASRIPLGRYGTPDEVAALIAFLSSDDALFISGSTYTIDGGMTHY
jgi:NAD(P)-dependent dehydrogenase (short-subunit alcohol dehydrogenase family)